MVLEHNKSSNIAGYPVIIPRFAPPEVAQVFISYVADILPFIKYVQTTAGMGLTHASPYAWCTDGRKWDSDKLSDVLAAHTTKYLGCRLTVASCRHMACCISRDMYNIPSPDDIDIYEDQAADLMVGRSTETGDKNYGGAITFADLASLS